MTSPVDPVLQQLQNLDQASPDFHEELDRILHGEDYLKCAENLKSNDPAWLIDYLDKAIEKLDISSPASRKCLRELRTVCRANKMLPSSYILPCDLLNIGLNPFAKGGFGDIYKATYNGSTVCVKRLPARTPEEKLEADEMFCKEAVMWKHLDHPNILPLLGVTLSPPQLVSNWMSGGNLSDYIKANHGADRLGLLHDAAKGLDYLHSRNVIHGDLKGINIVVDVGGGNPRACLADFGVTLVTKNLDSLRPATNERTLTPLWAAPEILGGKSDPTRESDVFSFAMVMVEVFTGEIPYKDLDFKPKMVISEGVRPERPSHLACTDLLWDLMQRCWDHDPGMRPKASEILQTLSVSVSS